MEQQETRVLRTAANGMEVWVPVSRLETWEQAQKDQSPEAKAERESMTSKIMSRLSALRNSPAGKSE